MVERNRFLTVLSHLIMIVGVLVVAFPVYLTFVASTHTTQEVVQVPMPLLPGSSTLENYRAALFGEGTGGASHAPVANFCQLHSHQLNSPLGEAFFNRLLGVLR